jgi:DNA-binding GntR family transcriptional regulator
VEPDARQQVARLVLSDQLKEVLLERILVGQYPPGRRLVETQIAQEFGTSHGPVREALRSLEALRLVQTEPFRGASVRAFSRQDLMEIYPVRAALEEVAARLAVQNLDDSVDGLRLELDAMRDAARQGDLHREIQHDVRFHRRIVEAAGNEVLLDVWLSLGIELRTTITFMAGQTSLGDLAERHQILLDALLSRDPEKAGRAARVHIEELAAILTKQGRDAPLQEGDEEP